MELGAIVTYAPTGPLSHVMAGLVGEVREGGRVQFGAMLEPVRPEHLNPARLWWRRGAGEWQGPFNGWPDARPSLAALCPDVDELESGVACPDGAEIVSGGWRYRIAWGSDDPPQRFGR